MMPKAELPAIRQSPHLLKQREIFCNLYRVSLCHLNAITDVLFFLYGESIWSSIIGEWINQDTICSLVWRWLLTLSWISLFHIISVKFFYNSAYTYPIISTQIYNLFFAYVIYTHILVLKKNIYTNNVDNINM